MAERVERGLKGEVKALTKGGDGSPAPLPQFVGRMALPSQQIAHPQNRSSFPEAYLLIQYQAVRS